MKEMTTKHGHKWLLPETVGEFQNAGVNLDEVCRWAGQYISKVMASRSSSAVTYNTKFSPDIASFRHHRNPEQSARDKAWRDQERLAKKTAKITAKLTPEVRAALLAELQKEVDNGQG